MGFLAWIQKQFGIPMVLEKEKSQVSAPSTEGQFKVLAYNQPPTQTPSSLS